MPGNKMKGRNESFARGTNMTLKDIYGESGPFPGEEPGEKPVSTGRSIRRPPPSVREFESTRLKAMRDAESILGLPKSKAVSDLEEDLAGGFAKGGMVKGYAKGGMVMPRGYGKARSKPCKMY
jgi:hypothetical protein